MTSRCTSCGAAILWSRTVTGKAMPIDAAPSVDGNIVLIEVKGRSLQSVVAKGPDEWPTLKRHKSHFATCASAAQHRKPKGKRA